MHSGLGIEELPPALASLASTAWPISPFLKRATYLLPLAKRSILPMTLASSTVFCGCETFWRARAYYSGLRPMAVVEKQRRGLRRWSAGSRGLEYVAVRML